MGGPARALLRFVALGLLWACPAFGQDEGRRPGGAGMPILTQPGRPVIVPPAAPRPGPSEIRGFAPDSSERMRPLGPLLIGPERFNIEGLAPSDFGSADVPLDPELEELPLGGEFDFSKLGGEIGPLGGMTIDDAIGLLLRSNLDLRALAISIPQAQADVLTASLRANPLLSANALLIPYGAFSNARPGGQTQYNVNINYPLDLNGKRAARMLVACRAARVLEARYQDAVRGQVALLSDAFVTLLDTEMQVLFVESELEAIADIFGPFEARYAAGDVAESERDRLVLRREQAELAAVDADRARIHALRELSLLLNLPAESAEEVQVRGTLRERGPSPPGSTDLREIAESARPDLAALRLEVRRAEAEVELEHRNRFGDVFVLAEPYTFQDNSPFGTKSAHSWGLGVTVPIPINDRRQGIIRRAELEVLRARTNLAARERLVQDEVYEGDHEYELSRASVERFEAVSIPAAVRLYDEARRRFREGLIDGFALIEARRQYAATTRQYLALLVQHRKNIYLLNQVAGVRLLP